MVSIRILLKKTTFFLAPILFSPLLYYQKEHKCIYVISVMCVYWLTEVIPVGITALIPLLLFPFFQIQSAKDASMSYFKDTTILGITSLIMGVAVEEVKLHKRIALGLLKIVGFRKQLLLLGVSCVTAMVSWLIADMASTAMMLPIVIAILETWQNVQKNQDESESVSVEEGNSCKPTETKAEKKLDLKAMTRGDRGFCKALILATSTSSLIGGTATLTGTMPNLIFRDQMGSNGDEVVTYLEWMLFSIPFQPLFILANHLVLVTFLMGPTAFFCWSCGKGKNKEEKKEMKKRTDQKIIEEYKALGKFSFAEASVTAWFLLLLVIWITRKPGFVAGWGDLFPNGGKGITDATVAVFVAVLMFFWPKNPFYDEKLEPILEWKVMKTKFSWQCVLLVAVGNSISDGVKASGLSTMLGCFLRNSLESMNSFWLQVMAQLSAAILTEFTSNTSTAGILVPIMISLATAFHLNPLYLVIPCTYACSFGFITPMATPGNAVVYDTGYVNLFDMALTGIFLKAACIAITALDFETLAMWLLDLNEEKTFMGNTTLNC